jgi:hypothetical protein
LPAAHLDGPELDLRLLVDHRERLVRQRVAINNTLRWHLHDLWPDLQFPGSALFYGRRDPGLDQLAGKRGREDVCLLCLEFGPILSRIGWIRGRRVPA